MNEKKIVTILLLALSFLILPPNSILVVARNTYTYNPPKKLKKPTKSRMKSRAVSAGSRGCDNPNLASAGLRLLIPKDHVGLTTSGHPTFFWYVSTKSAVNVRFTLVDLDEIEPVVDVQQEVQKSGVVKLSLPSQVPELKQGKSYRWTVSLICNPKRPSQNAYAYSWIERIPQSANLVQQLKTHNSSERAAIYAREGIWYDALAEAYNQNSNSEYFISLISHFDRN